MQTVSPACTHTTHNCIEIILFLLDLQKMTIKHPLHLSMLITIYILPSAHVIQTFLVINQTRTPLDYLSRLDKLVPRLEEEERGGRKCNFKDTVLCMAGQHFCLFLLPLGSSYNILCPKTSEHFTDITWLQSAEVWSAFPKVNQPLMAEFV